MKNTHPFYIVFEFLKVLLLIIFKMEPLDFLFLFVLCQISHQQISFFTDFQSFKKFYLEKQIFVKNLPFLTDSLSPSLPPFPRHPLNGQNLLSVTKVFCRCSLTFFLKIKKGFNKNRYFMCQMVKLDSQQTHPPTCVNLMQTM